MINAILPENETNAEDLEDIVSLALEPMELYFEVISDRDEKVACVGQALHELARERINEALSLVKTHVGRVKIHVAMVGNSKGLPVGTMLSCRLESGREEQ